MTPHPHAWTRWDLLWLLVCGGLSSFWCLTASTQLSATFDEPFYLEGGLQGWRDGSSRDLLEKGTMPLPMQVMTLPLVALAEFSGQAVDCEQDFASCLRIARATALLFWWVLLIYVFQIAATLAGPLAGRLALALVSTEPNLLGHATLATTDIPLTASYLALLYHYARWLQSPNRRSFLLVAILYGVAMLTKASTLAYAPLGMFAIALMQRYQSLPAPHGWIHWFLCWLRDTALIGVIGLTIVFFHAGCDWSPQPSFIDWASRLSDQRMEPLMVACSEQIAAFPNAGQAILRQVRHNMQGHGVYLLGETAPRAIWYYFPVALLLKMNGLLLLSLGFMLIRYPRLVWTWPFLVAVVLMAFSLNCRVQIGIRFLFPSMVLLIVAWSITVARLQSGLDSQLRRRLIACVVAAITFQQGHDTLSTWPDGVRYFHDLVGGSEQGHRYLSDSNLDWGQGLLELEAWRVKHGVTNLDLWYFGTDPRAFEFPMRWAPLHILPVENGPQLEQYCRGRYLAVGTSVLYGTYVHKSALLSALRQRDPIARTGTFFIYSFE